MAGLLVATACDVAHFELAEDLLVSLHAAGPQRFGIGFVQLGTVPAPKSITDLVDEFRIASAEGEPHGADEGFEVSKLAIKARLPEFFPGYDIYIWLDGDTWVQNLAGIQQIADYAHVADLCAHPQLDPNYLTCHYPDNYTLAVYRRLFGRETASQFVRFPMINSGVFGATARSPLWDRWRDALQAIRSRLEGENARFFSDQIPLHHLIFSEKLTIYPLRAANNWLVNHCAPRIDLTTGRLTVPSFPQEEINIVHLIGPAKEREYSFGELRMRLRYRDLRRLFGHLWDQPMGPQ